MTTWPNRSTQAFFSFWASTRFWAHAAGVRSLQSGDRKSARSQVAAVRCHRDQTKMKPFVVELMRSSSNAAKDARNDGASVVEVNDVRRPMTWFSRLDRGWHTPSVDTPTLDEGCLPAQAPRPSLLHLQTEPLLTWHLLRGERAYGRNLASTRYMWRCLSSVSTGTSASLATAPAYRLKCSGSSREENIVYRGRILDMHVKRDSHPWWWRVEL